MCSPETSRNSSPAREPSAPSFSVRACRNRIPSLAYGLESRPIGAAGGLVGRDRGEGETGVVIDSHMDILPASAGRIPAGVADHPVAGTAKAAKTLDVQRPPIARDLMLVAVVGP